MTDDGAYRLLDSGAGRKLEAVAGHVIDRQAPAAFWKRRRDAATWDRASGVHVRSASGGGHWEWRGELPDSWEATHGGLKFEIAPTPFGHIGLFAEQADQWTWLRTATRRLAETLGRQPDLLNLFAYTGGSTLAAAESGAAVTHVDASHASVERARTNARLNELSGAPIRWIVDDCRKFVARERRRGRRYDGVILDPPSFGRGKKGEVWKIEDDVARLLSDLTVLVAHRPALILVTCHSPGFTGTVLDNLLDDAFGPAADHREMGEMRIVDDCGRPLPAGTFARRFV